MNPSSDPTSQDVFSHAEKLITVASKALGKPLPAGGFNQNDRQLLFNMALALANVMLVLLRVENKVAISQAELRDALQTLENSVQQLGTDMEAAFVDLKNRIPPGVDLQQEFDTVQSLINRAKGFDAEAAAEVAPGPGPAPDPGSAKGKS